MIYRDIEAASIDFTLVEFDSVPEMHSQSAVLDRFQLLKSRRMILQDREKLRLVFRSLAD